MSGSGSLVTTRSKYSLFIYLLYCLNLGITIYLYKLISIIFLQRTYKYRYLWDGYHEETDSWSNTSFAAQ